VVAELWARRDYTTISPGALSDAVARTVLEAPLRERVLARTRALLRENYGILDRWLGERAGRLSTVPPRAGAIALVRYAATIGSTALAERLLREQGVLVVPGDQFGTDGFLRLGFGNEREHLRAALERLGPALDRLDG
jgi:aspartate/methionine/tyrosine aminotransferase